MENKTNVLKKIRKRMIALALATSIVLPVVGCQKDRNEKESEIGFLVESTSSLDTDAGLYSYVINTDGLESQKYDFSDTTRNINLVKVVEKQEYGTTDFNNMTPAYYRQNLRIIWPSCFNGYGIAWFNDSNFDCSFTIEEVKACAGGFYTIVYSSMTAKRDLLGPAANDVARQLEKGDVLSSVAIYFKEELVAYKQMGVGSDCENVIASTVGNVDVALSKISDLGILDEVKIVNYRELYEYQEELNNNNKNKILK